MHERSLVRSLLTQVEELRTQHNAVSIDRVTVEIGPLSGVEALLVDEAFQQLAPLRFGNTPQLLINIVPLQVRCLSCGLESTLQDLKIQCTDCGSVRVHITHGDEFRLIDVDMQLSVSQPV